MAKAIPSTNNNYIGIMSGTSLDAVDVVLTNFSQRQPVLIASHSHPIPSSLRKSILAATNPQWQGSIASIGILHQQLGELFADASNYLIQNENIDRNLISAIGSHGQTLWHQPQGKHPFSLQLGDANIIVERTGITTIADFRSRDIAAGGQGAPLVPAFHRKYLTHPNKNRIILNIGGISNITLLPAENSKLNASGYDTGPGNGLMDAWILKHKNRVYDKHGEWAKGGEVLSGILETLENDDYFLLPPPKSTGKETFNFVWLENKLGNELHSKKPQDIQATLTELTAKSISQNIQSCDELFVCGGGIHNQFLLERLQYHLPETPILSTEILGIDPDWMEAMAFSWLAKQTIEGKAGNLPAVTGAKQKRILGAIYSA